MTLTQNPRQDERRSIEAENIHFDLDRDEYEVALEVLEDERDEDGTVTVDIDLITEAIDVVREEVTEAARPQTREKAVARRVGERAMENVDEAVRDLAYDYEWIEVADEVNL
jgi:hypothetical protein